ncbi:MAG TPA: RodZ domain-containing protein [Candidatus Acidoferrales bacterium]|nr:RodZ domain-containing protein [Candidatus Acidoferrales bacterium]
MIDTPRVAAYIFYADLAMGSTHLFGEHLKREREMRGVSLEEISAATRISVRFLEALENEQWERLPGGIFNRGFIRSVARFLGLDEENLVAEYAMETHERPEIAVWTKEPVRKRANWRAIGGAIAVVILVIAGGWYVHHRYGAEIGAWHQEHPIFRTPTGRFHHSNAAAAMPSSPSPASSSQAGPKQSSNAPPSAVSSSPADKPQQPRTPAAGTPAQTNGSPTNTAPPNASASNPAIAAPSKLPVGNPATPGGLMELKVEAGETSTVSVLADGKVVFSGTLEAQRTLTLHAQTSFTVSSSKSNAVLLELNGHTVPPLGPPGEAGKITLTRDNLKANPGDDD